MDQSCTQCGCSVKAGHEMCYSCAENVRVMGKTPPIEPALGAGFPVELGVILGGFAVIAVGFAIAMTDDCSDQEGLSAADYGLVVFWTGAVLAMIGASAVAVRIALHARAVERRGRTSSPQDDAETLMDRPRHE